MKVTRHPVKVHKAEAKQTDLIANGFHCAADPAGLAAVGLEVGDQVRIARSETAYALYTISETYSAAAPNILKIGAAGRARVGEQGPFEAVLDTNIACNGLDDQEAEARSEFVERLAETDTQHQGLVVCAPHGGMIEPFTDFQAEHVFQLMKDAGKAVSRWQCKGWRAGGGAWERWHITSDEISPRSFGLLGRISQRKFSYALAFHGYDEEHITIGGCAPNDLKCAIRTALDGIKGLGCELHIADLGDSFAGLSPKNPVNWLTRDGRGGIQIEQPLPVRKNLHREIACAVARVFARLL